MDPTDAPSQSPIHSNRAFFDPTNMMGQNPLLHSPPLAHEHRYGLAHMPSAFSVIGRRPSFPSVSSHHHDFSASLTHDPLMVSTANSGLPRSPTTTTGSWWRQPANSHAQSLNNPEMYGNPLLWLPHDQEHVHSHEGLAYHNPQTYRNFEILNGSSPRGFYGSASFFPETNVAGHALHNIPTLSKERSISWEERLGHGHGLMLDSSGTGNGFSSWQELHQPKNIEKQRKPSSELSSEEKRNQGVPSNRSTNFEDNHSVKSAKPCTGSRYPESQHNTVSLISNAEPRLHERSKHSRQETNLPLEKCGRAQTESHTPSVPPVSQIKSVGPWKADLHVSSMNVGQYKRESLINTLDNTSSTAVYTSKAFQKPVIGQPIQSNTPVVASPTSIKTQRQTGGKPPLLERFREAGITRNDGESSSDDGSSEGGEDDDESESVSDENSDDEMSLDGEEEQKPVAAEPHVSSESGSGSEASDEEVEDEEEEEDGDGDIDGDGDGDGESNDGNQDSDFSQQDTPTGKRKSESEAGPLRKRRVVVLNEAIMKVPLEKGWRRQTKLRPAAAGGGLRGDVYYFAPCGKKLRTYPDVKKYLEKNGITDLDLNNFSFSMKLHIGELLECTQGSTFHVLTEEEIQQRKEAEEEKQKEKLEKFNKRKEKRKEQQENAKKAAEAKLHRKLERQAAIEASKQAKIRKAQERLQQKLEKQEMLLAAKKAKKESAQVLAEQKKKSKEEQKLQKLEKLKLEKEVKAQQLVEVRKKKKEDVANAKYHEAMKKAKERELRRQQAVLLKAQEKERIKEEKRRAKKLIKERKLEQKRREMILSRELKKPVEDMVLRDAKPLPELIRVKDLKISGSAFADLLMVQEFIHNFGEALEIDFETEVPSIADMQASLIHENDEDVVTPVCQMLLQAALDDPGVEGPQAETALGVKLSQVEVNEHNISEVLRLFILVRNAEPNKISDSLADKPFMALSPSEKAASLAFICNELLCGRTICREIENNIENMSTLRHNKWIAEGDLRKLKALYHQTFPESKITKPAVPEEKKSPSKPQNGSSRNSIGKKGKAGNDGGEDEDEEEEDDDEEEDDEEEDEEEEDEEEEEEDEDEDGRDEDDDDEESEEESNEEDKTEPETSEDFEKQIKRLERKQAQFRSKLFGASHSLRALYLGQDRFRRMFWVLPYGGSTFVEGKETGESGLEQFLQVESPPDKLISDTKLGAESIIGDTKTEKNIEEPSVLSAPPISRLTGECSEKKEIEESSNIMNKSFEHLSWVSNEKQMSTARPNSSESCPMKLLMQHVSSQGESTAQTSSTELKSKDLKFNNHHVSQTPVINRNHHSVIVSSASDVKSSDDLQNRTSVDPDDPPMPWFRLLPREPCDSTTVINCWMPRRSLDGSAHRKPGRPTKSPTITASEACAHTSTIQTNIDELETPVTPQSFYSLPSLPRPLTLDEVRRSVMESLRQDPASIPKEMQTGWWRIADGRLLKELTKTLHQRGIREKMLHKNILKFNDYTIHSSEKQEYQLSTETSSDEEDEDDDDDDKPEASVVTEIKDSWFPDQAFAANKNVLIEVEELEEKIFAASLQVKGWRLPPKASKTLSYSGKSDGSKPENLCSLPLTIAITRLAALEAGIERRYLKSPLRNDKLHIPTNIASSSAVKNDEKNPEEVDQPDGSVSEKEEVITPALKLWRETVSGCRTPAQLYMCLTLLNDCIAWEKSIMKVFCQMCRKGDNEELLLLCDGCDRGYHTYCCQPKLDNIPGGDWYCTDCIIMATGKSCCFVCRGTEDKLLRCAQCPRNYHSYCLDPPLAKMPRTWSCPNCKKVKSKSRNRASTTRRKRKKQIYESESDEKSNALLDDSRPHLNRKQSSKDMAPCRSLLAEMEKHEDAWPFLVPVNAKQFPEYYRIIEFPMDFHTMKVKLRDFQYTCRDEFARDTRLVFSNCNLFNEDDSEVGQAGKRLKKFFEKRWVEVNRDSDDL